jgi:gliding motility-associated lipoprotein GldD
MLLRHIILGCLVGALAACAGNEPAYNPKPKGYHRIELPAHAFQATPDSLPYWFEYSTQAKLLRDSSSVAERYWFELYYPAYTANIDISYKRIKSRDDLRDYVGDSYRLAQKHNIKAQAINEVVTRTAQGQVAVMYELEGDVPTAFQFYVTDSTQNFLRTSLYFPSSELNDSLAPLIDYIKEDMLRMMNTLRWKKPGQKVAGGLQP